MYDIAVGEVSAQNDDTYLDDGSSNMSTWEEVLEEQTAAVEMGGAIVEDNAPHSASELPITEASKLKVATASLPVEEDEKKTERKIDTDTEGDTNPDPVHANVDVTLPPTAVAEEKEDKVN